MPVTGSTIVKGLALVLFLSAIAAATYGVQQTLGSDAALGASALRLEATHPALNATPGHAVTYAITAINRGSVALDLVVAVSGERIAPAEASARVAASSNHTVFLTVQLPADLAPGVHALQAKVRTADGAITRERDDLLTLRILEPGPGFEGSDTAMVVYVGRLDATDRVFNTNDPALLRTNFAKADFYRPSAGVLPIAGGPEANVVVGVIEGIQGMQAGESRTLTIPPEKAYGSATEDEIVERSEALNRTFHLEKRTETVSRDTFDGYVQQTGQQGPFEAGTVFRFEQGPNRWPYRIESITPQNVDYSLAVQPGERYTLYPFWPNASEVMEVNATTVVFRTTPTMAVGEAFTMRSYWPLMSTVTAVNETHIVVQHSPPAGFKYSIPGRQGQPPTDATVTRVDDDVIVVAHPSGNPLAGQHITFDITMVELRT